MSVKLFCGFEFDTDSINNTGSAANITIPAAWALFQKPAYLFHNNGVGTLDQTVSPPHSSSGTGAGALFSNRSTSNRAYTPSSGSGWSTAYSAGSSVTRATWATAKGFQLAIKRSLVNPALTANEYWFSFELLVPHLTTSSLSSSYTPSATWGSIFKWGDVEIKAKETTFLSGSSSTISHSIVFSILNNGSEVTTLTIPQVIGGTSVSANTWLLCLLRVKLHATTGAIEFIVNATPQAASYTNQNTVQTTAEASATEIYIGPIVLDNGTTAYNGGIDNIVIDDAQWISGRIVNAIISITGDSSLTDAAAAGTSVTTVANALSTSSDAKQLRFSSANGKATLTVTAPTTTGYNANILAYSGVVFLAANRYLQGPRKIACGIQLSGVDSVDEYTSAKVLPFSSIVTPPETSGVNLNWYVFEKPSGGGKYQTSEAASILPLLKVVV